MTDFTLPDISEVTILRAENARLKMLLNHVLTDPGQSADDPLFAEAARYAAGDSGLQEILTQMVIGAIRADRETRPNS